VEVAGVPVVGGYVDPSLETILGLRPDLVVGARGPMGKGLVDKLEGRGIECYFPQTESVHEVFQMIMGVAERMDAKSRCGSLLESMRNGLRKVEKAVHGRYKPRTLLVFGHSPVSVAGPGSFSDEMLTLAGCDNAVKHGTRYPILGFETIIGLDPDLIVDATMFSGQNAEAIGNRPGWASVRAVREGRVSKIDSDQVLRPGPRLAEGVELICRNAHVGVEI